jgi:hypothetical protein
MKAGMYDWKKRHFVENLPSSNAMIYESACGTGLNLFMTLEIIQESARETAENITIYGNEYVAELGEIARQLAERQNDWYGQWVGEIVRIAKPGAPIIIEQVSFPMFEAPFDWGGVAPTFWKDAVGRYGWDVERSSIEMQDDTIFRKRYHVFMRKNV